MEWKRTNNIRLRRIYTSGGCWVNILKYITWMWVVLCSCGSERRHHHHHHHHHITARHVQPGKSIHEFMDCLPCAYACQISRIHCYLHLLSDATRIYAAFDWHSPQTDTYRMHHIWFSIEQTHITHTQIYMIKLMCKCTAWCADGRSQCKEQSV